MAKGKKRKRSRHDKIAIFLRIVIVLLLAFIIGLIVWFAMHDRNLRSGVTALKKGQYDKAITCFDTSIKAGEDVAESYRGKGMALYEQEKYKEAAEALITSIDKGAKQTGQVCNLIALSYMKQDEYKEAAEWFDKGIKDKNTSGELNRQMRSQQILCYEKSGQWEEAKESAQSYLSDYPEDEKMTREYMFLQTR